MTATEAFHAERRQRLGGTDIAAIFGQNPYVTAAQVRAEKLGEVEPFGGNDATELGELLEDDVIELYERRTGYAVAERNLMVRHPRFACLGAQVDGRVDQERVLNAKTAARKTQDWGEPLTDQVPPHYLWQAQMEMACTGAAWCDMPVLFLGARKLEVFTIARNARLIEAIETHGPAWWDRHVVRGEPCPDAPSVVLEIEPESAVDATDDDLRAWNRLCALRAEIGKLEAQKAEVEAALKDRLADARFLKRGKTKLIDYQIIAGSRTVRIDAVKKGDPTLYAELLARFGKDTEPSRRFCPRWPKDTKEEG